MGWVVIVVMAVFIVALAIILGRRTEEEEWEEDHQKVVAGEIELADFIGKWEPRLRKRHGKED